MGDILIIGLVGVAAALLYSVRRLRRALQQRESTIIELQRRVEASRAYLSALSDAAYDGLVVLDQDYRIRAINWSAALLVKSRNPVGQSLVEATDLPELESIVRSALTNEAEGFEEQLSIHERSYRVRAQAIRSEGILYIGLALQDVTQLVRLNRARRDMVANISHELRTPIANIRLIIDGLFHEQDKPKRKESISSLKAIARETDSLLWLVQEMADLSMIESGQAIVRMFEVPLPELVDEAIERIADQSDAKGIKIICQISRDVRVLCDRDLAKRVVVNLVHNAIKWSPKGATITVNAVNSADEVTISVLDHGPGVPDDQTERIFERFYQVDASRSGHEGTGLGLAICKHIIEAHGGRIWAEGNSQGGGGRFRFTLLSAEEHAHDE